jgi:L-alanine-DL-glutamate epimerase-like enolase superfamily enzyme
LETGDAELINQFTRREALALPGLLALGAGATPVSIRKVEAFPAPYGVTSYFRFLPKPERPSVLVKLECEDGTVGWGQSVPLPTWSYETPESVLSTIRDYLAPDLIGKSLFDIEAIHMAMKKAIASSFSTGAPIAKAGIDLAVHDALGKVTRRSVPELWARTPLERIELSWTVNARSMKEAEQLVELGKSKGFRHFNLKVAPDPVFDLELCKYVRTQAPNGFLWIDANGGYDLATALKVAPKFANLGVDVFEQPIAPNRLTGLRELKKQGALPIIFDEGVVSSVELVEFIRLGLLDGVAMKPARTAGLWDARKQVEILEDAGLVFLGSGLTDPDVSLAASLQLFGAYQLKHPAALNGLQFLSGSYLKSPFALRDGFLDVPKGPGLGVAIDEQRIRQDRS